MAYDRDRRVEWQMADYGMYLDCPYHEEFLEEMKATVPSGERRWDGDRRQWWISDCYLDEVDSLIFIHFEKHAYGRED